MSGYGIFRMHSRNFVAHRVAYMWSNGPIPNGYEVDHMCFTRACVNPDHLRLLTHQQNGQNRSSANANSRSGVRGVYWNEIRQGWMCAAVIGDHMTRMGPFSTADEAEQTIVAWRREHMPASLNDQRKAV